MTPGPITTMKKANSHSCEEDLYPHQREAISKMHNGCILCSDTGNGKSRTALAYYFIHSGGHIGKRFGDKDYVIPKYKRDLYIITTAKKRDQKDWEKEMIPFILLDAKKVDSWNNIAKYRKVVGAFFIFDEQHVTGGGPWVKSFYDIARKNEWILLTATPGDNWKAYIPVFVANGFYRNKSDFMQKHAIYDPYITKYPKIKGYAHEGVLLKYRNKILVNMPFVKDNNRYYYDEKVAYDRAKYKEIFKKRWDPWKNQPIRDAASLCYLLRKVCNEDVSRCEAVYSILLERHKIIVFYSFDYELEILQKLCDSIGVTYAEWNGHKHEPLPTCDEWVYLVNYMSGSEGWNCITTDTVVFYSLQYSYTTAVQAEGRIDRLDSPYKVLHYYRLISNAPIDFAIMCAYEKKKDFNEKLFIGG